MTKDIFRLLFGHCSCGSPWFQQSKGTGFLQVRATGYQFSKFKYMNHTIRKKYITTTLYIIKIIFLIIIAIITHYIDHHKNWQFFYHILGSYGIRIISHTYKGYYLLPHYLAFTSSTWVFVTLTTVFLLRYDLLINNVFQSWSQAAKQFTPYQYLQHKVFALIFWYNMPKYMIGYIY